MVSVKWRKAIEDPISFFKVVSIAAFHSLKIVISRVLVPFRDRKLSLRNEIARIWIGKIFMISPGLLYSEPTGHDTQDIRHEGSLGYLIPTANPDELVSKHAIILYAHGGGYIVGHSLQYLDEYKRWVRNARQMGKSLAILTVEYPLSTEAKWPAQRNAFLSQYEWLLNHGVSPSKIVFAGDSAGGNLVLASLMHIRDHATVPQPSCAVLISPWTDMSGAQTRKNPLGAFDFILNYDDVQPVMNDTLRPVELPFDTPEISPVLARDVSRLPPQLVFYGDIELLSSDSTRWIKKSQEAGVSVTVHVGKGQMHTFSLGWPISGARVQKECDEVFLNYIFAKVGGRE